MVIDYRQLNKRILSSRAPDRNGKVGKVPNYPIPTIESLLLRLEGCEYFSISDSGKFQWNVLPFGIGIGVQTFSFVINKAIRQCSDFAANYLDNIIVFLQDSRGSHRPFGKSFCTLQRADLKIKASKCEFFKNHVCYLGFLI